MAITVTVNQFTSKEEDKYPCLRVRITDGEIPKGDPLIVYFVDKCHGIPLSGVPNVRKCAIEQWLTAEDICIWAPCSITIKSD